MDDWVGVWMLHLSGVWDAMAWIWRFGGVGSSIVTSQVFPFQCMTNENSHQILCLVIRHELCLFPIVVFLFSGSSLVKQMV